MKTEDRIFSMDECIDTSIEKVLKAMQISKQTAEDVPITYMTFSKDELFISSPLAYKTREEFKKEIDSLHKQVGKDWIDVLIFECKLLDDKLLPRTSDVGSRAVIFVPMNKDGIALSHVIPFSYEHNIGLIVKPEKILEYSFDENIMK